MKTILSLVLAAAVCNFANAASAAETVTQCYNRHGSFNIGKTALPGQCGVRICKEDGTFDDEGCFSLSVAPGWIIVPKDLWKPFPDCCETVVKAEDAKQCGHPFYGTFDVGKTALTKQCGVAICREDQRLDINLCPSILYGPGYDVEPADLSKPYPECCGKLFKVPSA